MWHARQAEESPGMMKMMKRGRGQEGIALVITLLVMTLLLIMGSAFMSISSTETMTAINERNRVQAYHLAEAAAEMAIAQLTANSGYVGTIPQNADVNLGPGSYRVDVCPPRCSPPAITAPADPNQRIIVAMGCVRNCNPPSAPSRVEGRVEPGCRTACSWTATPPPLVTILPARHRRPISAATATSSSGQGAP